MRATVLVSFVFAVAIAPTATAQRGAILRVRVLMDSTKRPVPGAEVVIGERGLAVAADSLGRFRFAGIPPGRHTVLVRRIGFESFSVARANGSGYEPDSIRATGVKPH